MLKKAKFDQYSVKRSEMNGIGIHRCNSLAHTEHPVNLCDAQPMQDIGH